MAKIERTPSPYTLFLTEKLKGKVGRRYGDVV
jgi:hypothetical protein